MIKTRHNVFETNSSSSHSITVDGKGQLRQPEGADAIRLTGGEFGWEVEDYNDFFTKANYVAQDNEDDPRSLAILEKVIADFTGREVHIAPSGYVDHQSRGTTGELFEEPENDYARLRQFLFNSRSQLHTDNDNH